MIPDWASVNPDGGTGNTSVKASLKFWTVLLCAGLILGGCDLGAPENPDDEKPDEENPDEPTEEPLTDGSLFTVQLNDDIMALVGTGTWNAIAYGNGKYVAVGDGGWIAYSTNGVDWTQKQIGTNSWDDIVYNSQYNIFVAVGLGNYIVIFL